MLQLPDKSILETRRKRLAEEISRPVMLWSGNPLGRNFPANQYPFRASSHFLYFAGLSLENAVIKLENHKLTLFKDESPPQASLWHGETSTREEIATAIGAEKAYPLSELPYHSQDVATVAVQDLATYQQQCQLLQRKIAPSKQPEGIDLELAKAIVKLRLINDRPEISSIQEAINVSIQAHLAGMKATPEATTEAEVRAQMEAVITAAQCTCAYNSIVTVHGQVLHNQEYHHPLEAGDLLLADVGAETASGWASDLTRTWPVNGRFQSHQRDIYDIVLAAHDVCIEKISPGVEYRDIHLLAAKVLAEGLVDLGILQGNPSDLVEMDAHALFFPHGIGHILGLDVHDMEDLGDLAGYAPGRVRSDRFGLGYLRLHRPLQVGMIVTIEPGFYQVPAILNNPQFRSKYQEIVNWERLSQFSNVRGIRIEDDVLVTDSGAKVLSAALPTSATEIENHILYHILF